jgi:tetratricopeptide (TPR) repeat protein
MFRRLGLHPGPDIDAHAAAALSGLSLATARRHLEAIYDQHLLTELSRGRYRMHDLVREHARALAAADHAATSDATGRLMDYYLQTALAASHLIGTRILNYMPALPAGNPPACAPELTTASEATNWMQAEEANLRAAAEHAAATGRDQPATLIPAAMAQFLYVQGRWQDGIALHQTAVTAARNAGDQAGQVRALSPLIHMQMMIADYTNARASLNQSLALERELGDRAGEAESLLLLGLLYTSTCDLPRAMAHCLEALAISREISNDRILAASLHGVGCVHLSSGNYRAAAASNRQALDLYRAIGSTTGQAEALIKKP